MKKENGGLDKSGLIWENHFDIQYLLIYHYHILLPLMTSICLSEHIIALGSYLFDIISKYALSHYVSTIRSPKSKPSLLEYVDTHPHQGQTYQQSQKLGLSGSHWPNPSLWAASHICWQRWRIHGPRLSNLSWHIFDWESPATHTCEKTVSARSGNQSPFCRKKIKKKCNLMVWSFFNFIMRIEKPKK